MDTMTTFEYAIEVQKKSGPDAPVTWLTVSELIDLLSPQEEFLNLVEMALTDPAHDAFHMDEPARPEAEATAAEISEINGWLGEPPDWKAEAEADHKEWMDWIQTREDNRPR